MAHGDVVPQVDAELFFHPVQHAIVLPRSHSGRRESLLNIATQNGVHPDARVFAENHVADDLRGVVNVTGVRELWGNALVGTNHGREKSK